MTVEVNESICAAAQEFFTCIGATGDKIDDNLVPCASLFLQSFLRHVLILPLCRPLRKDIDALALPKAVKNIVLDRFE